MWIRGPADQAVAAAADAGVDTYLTITADEVSDIPFIKAAIDTFLVLDVLGVAALILVLVVAIAYLQARQRSRIVATALSTRMGLRSGTMRRSLVIELATLLVRRPRRRRDHGSDRRSDRDPVSRPVADDPTGPDLGHAVDRGRGRGRRSGGGRVRRLAGWRIVPRAASSWVRCFALRSDGDAVRCERIERVYRTPTGEVHALHDVSCAFSRGAITAIVGPSGSGKSSLLRLIAGMDRPSSGSLVVEGLDVGGGSAAVRRRLRRDLVGYVHQRPSDNFLSHLTVGEHLRLAGRRRNRAGTFDLGGLLDLLGIGHRVDHLPSGLSGGEQQRAAFAEALATGASIIVADEPTAELDVASSESVLDRIRALAGEGVTFLLATHDPAVLAIADERLELEHGRVKGVRTYRRCDIAVAVAAAGAQMAGPRCADVAVRPGTRPATARDQQDVRTWRRRGARASRRDPGGPCG